MIAKLQDDAGREQEIAIPDDGPAPPEGILYRGGFYRRVGVTGRPGDGQAGIYAEGRLYRVIDPAELGPPADANGQAA